jgi:hypothetical protein
MDALAVWCRRWLGAPPAAELFESGYLSMVKGLRLADGREVVVKVRPGIPRLAGCAIVHCGRPVFRARSRWWICNRWTAMPPPPRHSSRAPVSDLRQSSAVRVPDLGRGIFDDTRSEASCPFCLVRRLACVTEDCSDGGFSVHDDHVGVHPRHGVNDSGD